MQFASDGSSLSPYTHLPSRSVNWTPTAATASDPDNADFGIATNGYYLLATRNVRMYVEIIFFSFYKSVTILLYLLSNITISLTANVVKFKRI